MKYLPNSKNYVLCDSFECVSKHYLVIYVDVYTLRPNIMNFCRIMFVVRYIKKEKWIQCYFVT